MTIGVVSALIVVSGLTDALTHISVMSTHVSVLVLGFGVAACAPLAALRLPSVMRISAPAVVLAAYIVALVTRLIISGGNRWGYESAAAYLLALSLFITACHVLLHGDHLGMLRTSIIVASLLMVGVFVATQISQAAGGPSFVSNRPWALAMPLAVAASLSLARRCRAWLCLTGLCLVLVAVSASRIALAACVVVLLLAAVTTARHPGRTLAASLVAVVALGAAAVAFLAPVHDRIFVPHGGDRGLVVGGFALDTSGRAEYWRDTWEDFTSSPVVGHGLGAASAHVHRLHPGIEQPLNDYLRVMDDGGLVGLALLAIAGVSVYTTVLRAPASAARNRSEVLLVDIARWWIPAFALTMLTDNPIVYYWTIAPMGAIAGGALGALARHASALSDVHGFWVARYLGARPGSKTESSESPRADKA